MSSSVEENGNLRNNTIVLFDLDGTLTLPRLPADQEMIQLLKKLRGYVTVGIVSGSNQSKVEEQLKAAGNVYEVCDYLFPENGTVARFHGEILGTDQTLLNHLGEKRLQELVGFALRYIADLEIPVKRGTFIEYRT